MNFLVYNYAHSKKVDDALSKRKIVCNKPFIIDNLHSFIDGFLLEGLGVQIFSSPTTDYLVFIDDKKFRSR